MAKKQEQREYIQQFQREQALWQQQEKVRQTFQSKINYIHFRNDWQKKQSASNSIKSKKRPKQLVDKLKELKNLQPKNMFKVSQLLIR